MSTNLFCLCNECNVGHDIVVHTFGRSSGTSDKLSAIRLDDMSTHSEMSDTSQTPALRDTIPSAAPFALKKSNPFKLRGNSSNKDVVAAAVASALHMPTAPTFTSTKEDIANMDSAPRPTLYQEEEEEEDLRL